MESWCKTASQKINALSKIAALMNFEQRRLIINLSLFILSSFVDVSQPKTKCPHEQTSWKGLTNSISRL